MKAPIIAKIPEPTTQTSFSEKARQAKKAQQSPAHHVKRSFSLGQEDASYIESMALTLGTRRGKTMSVSEALRVIIADHRSRA